MERIIVKKQSFGGCCVHLRYRFVISILIFVAIALNVTPVHKKINHPKDVISGRVDSQSKDNNLQGRFNSIPPVNIEERKSESQQNNQQGHFQNTQLVNNENKQLKSQQNNPQPHFQDIPPLNSEEDRLKSKLTMVGKTEITSNCTKKYPKCIIIGVMKGGTEAFSTFLGIHPRIAMQFRLLSTRFFTNLNYDKGLDWYLDQMPCTTDEQITVEKAPQYFPSGITPQRIHEFNSLIQLILLVRHPIHRAVSHFLQQQYANPQRLNGEIFEQNVLDENGEIDANNIYIYQSSYITILQKWLKYFSLNQILIIDGDNFRGNAVSELARAEKFLQVEPYIKDDMFELHPDRNVYCVKSAVTNEDLCLPSEKGRKHPDIQPEVYNKLAKYFKPLNEEFMKTVGLRFDWD